MKKLTIAVLMLLGTFSMASAELGINIGISASTGVFEAQGTEVEDTEKQAEETGMAVVGWGSIFLEKTLGSRLVIGVDYVPSALASETSEAARTDQVGSLSTNVSVNQKIQADFDDLTTYYVAFNVTENFFIKGGSVHVDVITNEALGTGSTYPNASLDGNMMGAGYHKNFDNGMFMRAEGNVMEFDGVTLSSSTNNTVSVDDLNGVSAKISIGKSF
tara:strand:- start:60 stop:710 length:651 start_codon:yes stop_codon:yes gene_type:complete